MSLLKSGISQLSAFAPATSANLGVGFDIMGLALDAVGDTVTLTKRNDGQKKKKKITMVKLSLRKSIQLAAYHLNRVKTPHPMPCKRCVKSSG